MTDTPKLDWTREQRREWADREADRIREENKESLKDLSYYGLHPSILRVQDNIEKAKWNPVHYQRMLADDSTPKSTLRGDILLAVQRFEEATGVKVGNIAIDGDKVEVSE